MFLSVSQLYDEQHLALNKVDLSFNQSVRCLYYIQYNTLISIDSVCDFQSLSQLTLLINYSISYRGNDDVETIELTVLHCGSCLEFTLVHERK